MNKSDKRRATRQGLALMVAGAMALGSATANERLFTYSYEPETLTKGSWEFEQWVTWRGLRNDAVGKRDYSRWELREEIEYGVTDRYTTALYWNIKTLSYKDSATNGRTSETELLSFSSENRYMLLNPAENPVGVTLYVEPTFSDREIELEQKIIIGQRHGDWKWAVNLIHETEWSLLEDEKEGVVDLTAGVTRNIGKHWSLGLELRDHNEIPEYKTWENTALFVGPVASYRAERWWITMTVLPQIFGKNFGGEPDGRSNLELEGHEKINVRLIAGISF